MLQPLCGYFKGNLPMVKFPFSAQLWYNIRQHSENLSQSENLGQTEILTDGGKDGPF